MGVAAADVVGTATLEVETSSLPANDVDGDTGVAVEDSEGVGDDSEVVDDDTGVVDEVPPVVDEGTG